MIHPEIARELCIRKKLSIHTSIKFQSLLFLILCGNNDEFSHGCKVYDVLKVNFGCRFEKIIAGNQLQRIVVAIVLIRSSLAINELVSTIFRFLAVGVIWRKVTSLRF